MMRSFPVQHGEMLPFTVTYPSGISMQMASFPEEPDTPELVMAFHYDDGTHGFVLPRDQLHDLILALQHFAENPAFKTKGVPQ